MASRAVLGTLVVVLAATNGVVAYLHWGVTDEAEPTGDQTDAAVVGEANQSTEPEPSTPNETTEATSRGESWQAPTWPVNTTWIYRAWTPENTTTVGLEVTHDRARVAGTPAYAVHRSADNRTVFFAQDTINRLNADGSQQEIYDWPLEDGKNWTIDGENGTVANVSADWVTDIVTPLGLYDGYKITAVYQDQNLTEVYHYVDKFRSYVRVDDYRNGQRTLTLSLIGFQLGE